MDSNNLLEQIGELIDKKLNPISQDVKNIQEQLNTVEMKIELVSKSVEKAQEETIEALSELVNTSYQSHEEIVSRIEKHLNLPQVQ